MEAVKISVGVWILLAISLPGWAFEERGQKKVHRSRSHRSATNTSSSTSAYLGVTDVDVSVNRERVHFEPGERKPNESKPNESKPNESKPNESKPNESKIDEQQRGSDSNLSGAGYYPDPQTQETYGTPPGMQGVLQGVQGQEGSSGLAHPDYTPGYGHEPGGPNGYDQQDVNEFPPGMIPAEYRMDMPPPMDGGSAFPGLPGAPFAPQEAE